MFVRQKSTSPSRSGTTNDPFEKQRTMFNAQIVQIVRMLNHLFTENYVRDENNKLYQAPLINLNGSGQKITYNYQPLSELFQISEIQQDAPVKNALFRKVCKNLIVLFSKPIPPRVGKSKASVPLVDIKPEDSNATNVIIATKDGEIIYQDTKVKVCNDLEIKDFKNYLYLKLKLLVYLNDILNLELLDDKNKYEKLLLGFMQKNPGKDVSVVKAKFEKWLEQVEMIIEQVMSDQYNFEILKKMVALFEQTDPTTVELCESIVPLCDNASSIDVSTVCSPDRINMHSVTEDICNVQSILDRERERLERENAMLDEEINKRLEKIPFDLSDFKNKVQRSLSGLEKEKQALDETKDQLYQTLNEQELNEELNALNQKSIGFLQKLEDNPFLKMENEIGKIDFEKIRDPQVLKKASSALNDFGNLLKKDKAQVLQREITNITRDINTTPNIAKSSFQNALNQQIKPLFEKRYDRDAINRYYQDLQKRLNTERDLSDPNTGYKQWFRNVVGQSKQAPAVQQQLLQQGNQRYQQVQQQLGTAKTPQQKAQVINQFKNQESKVVSDIDKQTKDRAKFVQKLPVDAREAFNKNFDKTQNVEEQSNLINAFSKLHDQPKVLPEIKEILDNKDLSPNQVASQINQKIPTQQGPKPIATPTNQLPSISAPAQPPPVQQPPPTKKTTQTGQQPVQQLPFPKPPQTGQQPAKKTTAEPAQTPAKQSQDINLSEILASSSESSTPIPSPRQLNLSQFVNPKDAVYKSIDQLFNENKIDDELYIDLIVKLKQTPESDLKSLGNIIKNIQMYSFCAPEEIKSLLDTANFKLIEEFYNQLKQSKTDLLEIINSS